MSFRPIFSLFSVLAVTFAVMLTIIPTAQSILVPPARFVGEAKKVRVKDQLGTAKHPNTPMVLNLSGNRIFRGNIETAGNSIGFPFDTKIFGKIQRAESRQGGGKWIITGKWTFKLNVNRLDRRGRGKFRAVITRKLDTSVDPAVFNYDVDWPIRVGHSGNNPETNYVFSGRFMGKTNP